MYKIIQEPNSDIKCCSQCGCRVPIKKFDKQFFCEVCFSIINNLGTQYDYVNKATLAQVANLIISKIEKKGE